MAENDPIQRDLLGFLDGLEEEAKSGKETTKRRWEANRDLFDGESVFPKTFLRDSSRTPFDFNRIGPLIRRHVGLLTDTKPTIEVLPQADDDQAAHAIADMLEETMLSIWSERSFSLQLARQIELAGIYSTAGCNVFYDPNLDGGRGDVNIATLSPYIIEVDPGVIYEDEVQSAEFIFTRTVKPLSSVRRRYPDKADLITSDPSLSRFTPNESGSGSWIDRAIARIGPQVHKPGGKSIKASQVPKVSLTEYWLRDYRTNLGAEPLTVSDSSMPGGTRVIPRNGRLFPGGRHIIRAGSSILVDEANPYWDGMFPIELISWDGTIWGRSEVDRLQPLQVAINKLGSVILENAIRMTNPVWIFDANALTKEAERRLTNAAGLKVPKTPGSEVRRDAAPPLPGYVFSMLQFLVSAMDDVSGLGDVSQGRLEGGALAGVAIEALQIASQVTVRERARRMEAYIERVFRRVLSRVFQFYTTDRIKQIFGDNEQIRAFSFKRDGILKRYRGDDIKKAFRDFLFSVIPGSSLEISRVQRTVRDMQLFGAGIIDDQAVLEGMAYPNWKSVLNRVNQKRLAAAQAAQVMQGGGVAAEQGIRSTGQSERGRVRIPDGSGATSRPRPRSQPAAAENAGGAAQKTSN
jgi:hypothetical protein